MSESELAPTIVVDRRDPVSWFLFHKLNLPPYVSILLAWALGAFEVLVLYSRLDYRLTAPEYFWFAAVIPTMWAYYARSIARIPTLFQNLKDNDIVEVAQLDEYSRFLRRVDRSYASPIWTLLAVVGVGASAAVIFFVTWKREPPPFAVSPWHTAYALSFTMINEYFVAIAALREFVAIFWLARLFRRFKIRVHALHPDNAGGLGFIGTHYLGLTLLVAAVGMWLSIWHVVIPTLNGEPPILGVEVFTGWSLYLAAAIASFFAPLWSTHLAMRSQRAAVLRQISSQFDLDFLSAQSSMDKDAQSIQDRLDKVKSLQEMQDLVKKQYPTWPFNFRTLQRFSITASLPVVTGFGSLALDIALK